MAIRSIRIEGDAILRKKSKVVEKIDERLLTLIEDMKETMYAADGVGLAAVQVGILKKLFVIDAYDGEGARVFINPEILEKSGSQIDFEGCLSIPGKSEEVERPDYVKVKATNEKGEAFVLEGHDLLARAILHENDHLYGILFVDYLQKNQE